MRLKPEALPRIYQNRGNLYCDRGEYDKALADYGEAIRLSESDHSPFYNRGIAHDMKGDHDQAIADYTEAIRLTPKNLQDFHFYTYFYNRGIVYDEKGDYEKAIIDYTSAIRLGIRPWPFFTDVLHNRYLAYKATGQHDKAEADFAKLKSLNQKYKEVPYRCERRGSAAFFL
jgi:tetratricopeptide (TPR) repeat protein